jgi:hypothetical protein
MGARENGGRIALLAEDPSLAAGLDDEERAHAERLVEVPGFVVAGGPLTIVDDLEGPSLGVLVLDGILTANIVLGDRVASFLAGPGDVLHVQPPPTNLVPAKLEYFVSDTARLAHLDRTFMAAARRWPSLLIALHERQRFQEHSLAVYAAIGKLRRVEDRVLGLLWHLAERWGRVGPDGIVLPLALTHETIGRLAGGERPTVSLALVELERTGEVQRREDGSFVLAHASLARLTPAEASHPQSRPLEIRRTAEAR